MKLNAEQNIVDRGDVGVETQFTIKATSSAFKILSSGLYSNKIEAIIRELSCNSVDSHVAAGKKDTPIDIHLPTHLDPTFYVKDYGIGLDHEGVTRLYSTYFDSTKQDSNDFIGALGLGSKSPFSYTSSFMVEARFDHIKRQYSLFINENGLPSVVLMGEEKTDEPNGLTVTMSVKKDDISKFETAAKKALMYFTPKPNFVGKTLFAPYDLKHTVTGSNWKIRESDYYAHMRGPYVVQGFVAYPVDTNQIGEHTRLSDAAAALCGVDIDLYVSIGKVEPAASRESLSYDKRTIVNLISELETAAVEMRQSFQSEFDKCKTMWEAVVLRDKFVFGGSGGFKSIFRGLEKAEPFKTNGKVIPDNFDLDLTDIKETTISVAGITGKRVHMEGKWDPSQNTSATASLAGFGKREMHINGATTVIVDTEAKGNRDIYKQYIESCGRVNTHAPHVIILRPISKNQFNQDEINEIVSQLGNPEVKLVTSLGFAKTKTASTYVKKMQGSRLVWRGFEEEKNSRGRSTYPRRVYSRKTWDTQIIDLNAGGYYVPTEKFACVRNGGTFEYLDKVIEAANKIGLVVGPIRLIGMNEAQLKEAQRAGVWVNFFDDVAAQFVKHNSNNELFMRTILNSVYMEINHKVNTQIVECWASYKDLVEEGEFKKVVEQLVAYEKAAADVNPDHVNNLVRYLDLPGMDLAASGKIVNKWKSTIGRYEMLSMVEWNYLDDRRLKKIINYVNLCDKKAP